MAERIPDSDLFDQHPHRLYPWDEWEDGHAWLVVQGIDFDVSLKSMQSQIMLRGRNVNKRVVARLSPDPNRPGVRFKFFPDQPHPSHKPPAAPPAEPPAHEPPHPN